MTVDGRPLASDLYARLTLLRVDESVHLPDAFTLRFDDPHFELFDSDTFAMGTRVEVALRAEGDPVVVTIGEVTAISVEPGNAGRHELVIDGLDAAHRLARGPHTRSFLRMTDGDIASRVAGDYGLSTDIDSTSEVLAYVLQTSESDFAFLRRRGARIGFDCWVTDQTLHFKRRPSGARSVPTLRWGENLQSFRVRFASSEHCDDVTVRGWDPVAKRAVVGRATEGETGTDAAAADEMGQAAQRAFGRVARFAGQFPVSTQAEADALAESLLLRASGSEVVLRGEAAGDPELGAGATVKLERVGQRLAGSYVVTSVEHLYGAGRPYVTRFTCGGKESAGLTDLLGGGASGNRGWGSLVVGVVTNNGDPDDIGRVKVKFPTLTEDDESGWARVVSPGAGPDRGLQWIPEVDDEVLVGFELDDKARPVVLGGLWSRTDKPPDPALVSAGKVNGRLLKSRNGHHLLLTDDPTAAVELTLVGDSAAMLHLEQADSTLRGETKLVITAKEIQVKATQKLQLEAPQMTLEATGPLVLKGNPIQLN